MLITWQGLVDLHDLIDAPQGAVLVDGAHEGRAMLGWSDQQTERDRGLQVVVHRFCAEPRHVGRLGELACDRLKYHAEGAGNKGPDMTEELRGGRPGIWIRVGLDRKDQ